MELVTERPSLLWFWGPSSIMAVYMDPLELIWEFPILITMDPKMNNP